MFLSFWSTFSYIEDQLKQYTELQSFDLREGRFVLYNTWILLDIGIPQSADKVTIPTNWINSDHAAFVHSKYIKEPYQSALIMPNDNLYAFHLDKSI